MHQSSTRTAVTAAAALALTVIAGFSAAAVTLDHGASVATPAAVQYVDQYGNPVAAPGIGTDTTASATGSTASATDRTPAPVVRNTGGDNDHEEDED